MLWEPRTRLVQPSVRPERGRAAACDGRVRSRCEHGPGCVHGRAMGSSTRGPGMAKDSSVEHSSSWERGGRDGRGGDVLTVMSRQTDGFAGEGLEVVVVVMVVVVMVVERALCVRTRSA